MCLAIPMRVIEVSGDPEDITSNQIAKVDADGISQQVRLDIVDIWPQVGDYVIIHAGFAIHTLEEKEAKINLRLLQELVELPEGSAEA